MPVRPTGPSSTFSSTLAGGASVLVSFLVSGLPSTKSQRCRTLGLVISLGRLILFALLLRLVLALALALFALVFVSRSGSGGPSAGQKFAEVVSLNSLGKDHGVVRLDGVVGGLQERGDAVGLEDDTGAHRDFHFGVVQEQGCIRAGEVSALLSCDLRRLYCCHST